MTRPSYDVAAREGGSPPDQRCASNMTTVSTTTKLSRAAFFALSHRRWMKLPVAAARVPLRQQRPLEVRALGMCAFKWPPPSSGEAGDAIAFFPLG